MRTQQKSDGDSAPAFRCLNGTILKAATPMDIHHKKSRQHCTYNVHTVKQSSTKLMNSLYLWFPEGSCCVPMLPNFGKLAGVR